ncbi:MAG: fibronectin type III domain-containing protein [Phycisphaerales bacterium]|nr:fibronectin type III domain-containing protein [Phycisphaerales bacterium]
MTDTRGTSPKRAWIRRTLIPGLLAFFFIMTHGPDARAQETVSPPTDVKAADVNWDAGGVVEVSWEAPTDSEVAPTGYQVWRSETEDETKAREDKERSEALQAVYDQAYQDEYDRLTEVEGVAPEDAAITARQVARTAAREDDTFKPTEVGPHGKHWILVDTFSPEARSGEVKNLIQAESYAFIVYSLGKDAAGEPIRSEASTASDAVKAPESGFDGNRLSLFIFLLVLCGTVLLYIMAARKGKDLKIRPIAGLQAVDEAVGRATEMGRPILYVNGIQDMDDLQTVAGVTVLGRVAKTAAEYDAKIEVPTSRSLVMSAARETVQASYLSAGRSDAYNPDLIYYVTDEQFGFTAHVSGLIVREKPAACFYMGAFFAESLILAETGNSVGAIQIAGTAMPSQLPFFVAACDYTLIGEEFFAASAYLSGQPDQLGSLKGQDVGKLIVGIFLVIGCFFATLAAFGIPGMESVSEFIHETLLQG